MNKVPHTVLLTYTKEDVAATIPLAGGQIGGPPTVIAADLYSWTELRRNNIRFKTPACYLDREKCVSIDEKAARLTRTWYKPIEQKLMYHGISLAEMAEYDFAHCFIDALRSIEIAKTIIDLEEPSEVRLPIKVPVHNANAIRYECLPKSLAHFADINGIRVTYYQSARRPSGRLGRIAKLHRSVDTLVREAWSAVSDHSRLNSIVFVDFPERVFAPIKKQLDAKRMEVGVNVDSAGIFLRGKQRIRPRRTYSWKDAEINDSFRKELVYDGTPLTKIMARRFLDFLENRCRLLMTYVDGTENFIKAVDPDLVVLTEDISPILRTITKTCKINEIPTLVIQHGVTGSDIGGFHVMPVEADVQAVWGSVSRDWGIRRGKAQETQVVTGNPAYDSIASVPELVRSSAIYERLRLNKQKGIVAIATSWYQPVSSSYTPEEDEAFIYEALRAMKRFPEKQTVIKLHPSYSGEYREIAEDAVRQLGIEGVVVTEQFLWELLYLCDLLITQTSTVGLEAMLLNKPVIAVRTLGVSNPCAECKGIVEVEMAEEELVSAIRDSLYNERLRETLAIKRKESLSDYAYNQDARAAERVACLIARMRKDRKLQVSQM